MNKELNTLEQLTTEVLKRESQEIQALSMLLDKYTTRKDNIFVQSIEMGGTQSYVGSVTLEWFSEKVRFASQLTLFKDKLDPLTNKVIIDKDTVDDLLQRPIDYSRQAVLAQYLAARPKHKFPPVLVVINQGWVDKPSADEWSSEGIALTSAAKFTPLDSSGKFGNLDISGEMNIYALDGQHRLLGIQGLMALIKTGKLQILDKLGKPVKDRVITIEELEKEYSVSKSELQKMGNETIGIEFISSVVPGESKVEAQRRVRSIFVHVNKMATQLTKGQLHQLDDDNGFAIVAKSVATNHPFLTGGNGKRINWDNQTISERSLNFTTLQALTEIVEGLIGTLTPFQNWKQKDKNLIPMRPDDSELDAGIEVVNKFFDQLESLPSITKFSQGTPSTVMRNFKEDIKNDKGELIGEGHILFRPVGQTALAEAVGNILKVGKDMESIFKKIKQFDTKGGFSHAEQPTSVFYGVLVSPKKAMSSKGEPLATRLMEYLFNGGIASESVREKLRQDFASARGVDDHYRKLDAKLTIKPEEIELPNPV